MLRTVFALLALSLPLLPADLNSSLFERLEFRSIGPASMGGRITDVEGVAGNPALVYVAFDRDAPRLPAWLADWVDTGMEILTDSAGGFRVYRKSYGVGQVILGGNDGNDTGAVSSYFVLAAPAPSRAGGRRRQARKLLRAGSGERTARAPWPWRRAGARARDR